MFQYFPNNYMWSAGLNRLLSGGGLIGEFDRAGRKLQQAAEQGDNDAWYRELLALGEQVERRGRRELEAGHTVSARGSLLRACQYFQWAGAFLPPADERRHQVHQRGVEVFARSAALYNPPIERVEVPYLDTSFPAWYQRPQGSSGSTPAVVFLPGLDSSKEQALGAGAALAERGMAVLMPDPPGVGEALFERGLSARFDYEVPTSAALEWLLARSEVQPDKVAVVGVSLGGYYAPRAAAFEPRFAACVAWGAIWDYYEVWERRRVVRVDSPVPALQSQLMLVTGADSFDDGLKLLKQWRLDGVAQRIQCPFLVTHGELDRQVPVADAYKLYEAAGSAQKELKVFTDAEGGSGHCQNDNRVLGLTYIADWLDDVLLRGRARGGVFVGEPA